MKHTSSIFAGLAKTLIYCERTLDKPNIVWLIEEYLSPGFGYYAHHIVQTSNIDKLTGHSVKFENISALRPVCSTSRSGFITGMYQTAIGADFRDTSEKNRLPLPNGVKSLYDYLYDAGYFVNSEDLILYLRY